MIQGLVSSNLKSELNQTKWWNREIEACKLKPIAAISFNKEELCSETLINLAFFLCFIVLGTPLFNSVSLAFADLWSFVYRSKPLQIWESEVRNGHIKRITDEDIQSSVLEIMGTNVSTNYISCPANCDKTLGIKLPFLVMIIKNLKKYFTFEVQVLDDKNIRRRFRASNYQSTTRVKPFICTMPMR